MLLVLFYQEDLSSHSTSPHHIISPHSTSHHITSHYTSSHNILSHHAAWSDPDFPSVKKQEMLDIKARPGYMGNPQGEGAIWQRTPSGVDVKVGTESLHVSLDFLILCCVVQQLLCLYLCQSDLLSLLTLLSLLLLMLLLL